MFVLINMIFSKESIPNLFLFAQIWSLHLENNCSLEILAPGQQNTRLATIYNLGYWFLRIRQNELKSPVNFSKRIKFNSFSISLSCIESFVNPSPKNDEFREQDRDHSIDLRSIFFFTIPIRSDRIGQPSLDSYKKST